MSRVLREASTYTFGLVGAAAIQFVSVPVLTRYLGPDQYSVLSLVLAVTSSLAGVLVVGGDVALTRFWFEAADQSSRRTLIVTWIGFLTVWSLVPVTVACVASTWIARSFAEDARPTLLIIGFALLVPAQLSRMLAQVLRNSFRPWPFAITSIGVAAASLVVGLALAIGLGLGVTGVLLGMAAGEALGVLVRGALVAPELRARPSWASLKGPLRFGIPFIPASLAFWVFTGMDRIAVGALMPAADLGAYAVAAMLVAPFTILLTALGQAWLPRITQDYEADSRRAATVTGFALEIALIVFGLGAIAIGALAPTLIAAIAGPGYEAGAQALPMLAFGSAVLGASLFASTGFTLAKKTGWAPVITVAAAALDIALLFVLIPRFGLTGASAAVAISYLTLTIGSLVVSQLYMPIPLRLARLGLILGCLTATSVAQSTQPGEVLTLLWSAGVALALVVMGLRAMNARGEHALAGEPSR